MSLATRCNACGTVFRVVRDQLRVSDGWVRCGSCHAVFNATDDLFELDEGGSPVADTTAPPEDLAQRVIAELDADRRRWQADASSLPVTWAARPAEGLDDVVLPPTEAESAADDDAMAVAAEESIADGDDVDELDVQTDEDGAPDLPPPEDDRPAAIVALSSGAAPAEPTLQPTAQASAPAMTADAAAAPPLPSFVRRADRAAFWRRPLVRAAGGTVAALLAVTLLAQIGHAGRDGFAARWPALEPTLHALCEATGCRVEPLKRIDRLSVDSAGLTLIEGAPLYRLQLVLHNRAETALAVPALELSLENAQGLVVARRVLRADELGLDSPLIAAGRQMPVAVTLAVRDRRVAGYHVELFYP